MLIHIYEWNINIPHLFFDCSELEKGQNNQVARREYTSSRSCPCLTCSSKSLQTECIDNDTEITEGDIFHRNIELVCFDF